MRLLHVTPSYLPAVRYGGPIYSVHALCAALVRMGHVVEVYTTNVDGASNSSVPLGIPIGIDGVRVTYFATGVGRRLYRSPSMGTQLRREIESFDVAHLHSVFLWPTYAAARTCAKARVPYVISPRGMLVTDLIERKSRFVKSAWIAAFERTNFDRADLIHFTSLIEKEEYDKLAMPSRPAAIIANGLDVPDLPHRATVPARAPQRILFLGRLNWKKGIDRLIRALPLVPSARLLIAGNDEEGYSPRLKKIADDLSVSHRVSFLGPVRGQEKWDLIVSADLFVLPSYSENFGNSVLEAMSCAIPVIVTPEVGLASTVREADAGLVVAGNAEALAHAINSLLANPLLRLQMGERGRRAVVEKFSWNAIAADMIAAYQSLAGRAPQPPSV